MLSLTAKIFPVSANRSVPNLAISQKYQFLNVEKTELLVKIKKHFRTKLYGFEFKMWLRMNIKNDQCRHTFWCVDLYFLLSHGLENLINFGIISTNGCVFSLIIALTLFIPLVASTINHNTLQSFRYMGWNYWLSLVWYFCHRPSATDVCRRDGGSNMNSFINQYPTITWKAGVCSLTLSMLGLIITGVQLIDNMHS